MIDLAQQLLVQRLSATRGPILWLVDEHGLPPLSSFTDEQLNRIQFMTNRYDQWLSLQQYSDKVWFNDFNFEVLNGQTFQAVFFRVAKEKALVHHCINAAARLLTEGGKLVLSGYKNEGIKTYISKAEKYLGVAAEKKLGGKTSVIASLVKTTSLGEPLSDDNYSAITVQTVADINFYSKPGVFGWQKVDQGSAFLVEQCLQYLKMNRHDIHTVIDLGCGYGYLSLQLSQQLDAHFYATDNNAAALLCCEKNFQKYDVLGEVQASNAGFVANKTSVFQQWADVLVCNPPFHQGFRHQDVLTQAFMTNSRKLLNNNGIAFWVVNRFIPVERYASNQFKHIELLAENKSFNVYLLKA